MLQKRTGLVPDAYFSASKIAWILDQRLSAVYGKRLRETVTADCNDTYFYFWNINHDFASLLYVIILNFC